MDKVLILATAKKLYEGSENKVKPTWDQLVHQGSTQSFWCDQARKLMEECAKM